MASTYSTRVGIIEPATGEDVGTWGTLYNASGTDIVDQGIAGVTIIAMPDSNFTMSGTPGTADQGRPAVIVVGGTLTAARKLLIPAVYSSEKYYTFINRTAFPLSVNSVTNDGVTSPVLVGSGGTVRLRVISNVVTSLENRMGSVKATAKWFGASGTLYEDGVNITTITRISAGLYEINMVAAVNGGNYIIAGTAKGTAADLFLTLDFNTTPSSTVFRVTTKTSGGTATDCDFATVVVFG